jgi:hypothetical protein
VADIDLEQIAAASRLTAAPADDHSGAMDLRDAWFTPGEYFVRLVYRDPRVGTELEPETPPPLPDLDGVEWWVEAQRFNNVPVPAWVQHDEWGGSIVCPTTVRWDSGLEVPIMAVLIDGDHRAEVRGRLVVEPMPARDARLVALSAAGASDEVAELVVGVLDQGVLPTEAVATVLEGLTHVDPDALEPDLLRMVGDIAVQLRTRERKISDAADLARKRWAFGVHGEVADG